MHESSFLEWHPFSLRSDSLKRNDNEQSFCVCCHVMVSKTHHTTQHSLAGKENVAALLTLGTSKAAQSSSWFLLSSQRPRPSEAQPNPPDAVQPQQATNLLHPELSLDSRSTNSWELQRESYFTHTCHNKRSLRLWGVNDCCSRCYLPCCSSAAALSATGRRWLHRGRAATPWSSSRLDSKEGKEKHWDCINTAKEDVKYNYKPQRWRWWIDFQNKSLTAQL